MVLNQTAMFLEAYPSLKEPDPGIFVVTGIFLVCFIVGICGNASTLTIILDMGTPKKVKKIRETPQDSFRVYVASLCVVDTLMLLSLPSTIVDSLIGFWIFGTAVCKFHHFCGSVGRIASTLVITSMSIDRYLVVVSPQKLNQRSSKTTLVIMLLLFASASLLLMPLLIFAKAQKVLLFESETKEGHLVQIRIFKCLDNMPTNLLFWFTGSTFFFGYFCPIIVITLFNILLLIKIRSHQQKMSTKSIIPMRKVTIYIMSIALFYFMCWTPYWMSVLYVSYVDLFESRTIKTLTNKSEHIMFLVYCAHIFPYINTALNWLLYGRLARNLRGNKRDNNQVASNGGPSMYNGECDSYSRRLIDIHPKKNDNLDLKLIHPLTQDGDDYSNDYREPDYT
ncbi:unnamed protein product [Bursaphelenchus okinawaensis]|uniref:G-protein coupled receptors family 1 profile domain-containing protein n=1 Tax=Bursaphelenchus okinawaensis TaxID=465554 RepID=A0A811KW58_9BILA|nr:unnamed protein product [Bursaphelenchus okinawaensis]CAG9112764.1 unnamed protein product [Bursaphelenchus okinawaensis]